MALGVLSAGIILDPTASGEVEDGEGAEAAASGPKPKKVVYYAAKKHHKRKEDAEAKAKVGSSVLWPTNQGFTTTIVFT